MCLGFTFLKFINWDIWGAPLMWTSEKYVYVTTELRNFKFLLYMSVAYVESIFHLTSVTLYVYGWFRIELNFKLQL
jgi:hypothetical protein